MKPVLCNYYVTYRCNATCSFCDIWEQPSPLIDLGDAARNLDDLRRLGVRIIDFTGGEPLLHPQIGELLAMAKERGLADDPVIRQKLAWCHSKVQVMKFLGMRTLTQFLAGHHPGPDAALGKLFWSEYHKAVTELAVEIMGADALVIEGRPPSSSFSTDDPGAANTSGSWVNTFLNARAGTIYAGSSQIQRNIIGEMVLGLPKEPKPA